MPSLFIAVLREGQKSMQRNMLEGLPVELAEIAKELIMPVDTDINMASVILSDVNKKRIEDFTQELRYTEKLKKHGLRPMTTLLFYGASGCGKTYLGKALSNTLGYTMLYVDIARALSQGSAAMNLTNVFKLANHIGHAIVFLDEADSIAWDRDAKTAEGGDIRRATNALFQLIDQKHSDVLVISATNMLHRLDPAFERRFDMKMEFKRPENVPIRVTIQSFLYSDFKLVLDRQDDITERRCKLSFAELEGVAHRLMKKAVLQDRLQITMTEVYMDISRTMGIKLSFGTDTDAFYDA